jgi:uncharacterized protein YbjT (DUF2867 family)
MILITGATGNVGREIVKQLSNLGCPIRVLTRTPEKLSFPKNVQVFKGSLDNPDLLKDALSGVKKVFLIHVPGSTQFPEIARIYGVKHIVFLSAAAIDLPVENVIGRLHRKTEEVIKQSGMEWTFLRPGAFMSNSLQWSGSIKAEGIVRAPFGDVASAPIDPRDIAAVAVKSLIEPGHENKIYSMSGSEILSTREQVQIISDVVGTEINFEEISPEVARERMRKFIPEALVDASLELMEIAEKHPAVVLDTVKNVTGENSRTFKQWATDHVKWFRN